jgi:hypothetical protein
MTLLVSRLHNIGITDEMETIWKETVLANRCTIPALSGGAEENHNSPYQDRRHSGPRFEQCTKSRPMFLKFFI